MSTDSCQQCKRSFGPAGPIYRYPGRRLCEECAADWNTTAATIHAGALARYADEIEETAWELKVEVARLSRLEGNPVSRFDVADARSILERLVLRALLTNL